MEVSNWEITDQGEVTAVFMDKSLLSIDYSGTSTQYHKGLTLTHIIQRALKFLTVSEKVMLGLRRPRTVLPSHPPSVVLNIF